MVRISKFFDEADYIKEFYSPDFRICCRFLIIRGKPYYEIAKNRQFLVRRSRLGFRMCDGTEYASNYRVLKRISAHNAGRIKMIWGEDRIVPNTYNEVQFHLGSPRYKKTELILTFRMFNDSVAFRYEIMPRGKVTQTSVAEELTEFNVPHDADVWHIPAYQPDRYEYNYERSYVGGLDHSVHTPLTMRLGFRHISVHEAALYDYGAMNLKPNEEGILQADITPLSDGSRAHISLPFTTPWRLIMVADSAIKLTKNRTMYALNDPPQFDFRWVTTLKFIGIWWAMYVGEWTWAPGPNHGATTSHAKEYIDAAVRLGISGLLIEGWNDGWEGDWLENGATSNFCKSMPDFDFDVVSDYARIRGVELVGHHETVGFVSNYEAQLEEAYNYYAARGVHYIKTGYSGSMMDFNGRKEYHHSQAGVNHYQKTVELAATKKICLDIHEPIKGTGLERTWPNLLAREGARGQEYEGGSLAPSHACILSYTRLLAGGMDYTSGIFDLLNHKKRIYTTICRQLAYFVTIYSGMTMVADRPFIYEERFMDIFDFVRDVPTNFSKTVPIAGEIGEYYVVARRDRDSDNWYIGGVTNDKARKVEIKFTYLNEKVFQATLYTDSADADYRTNPFGREITTRRITRDDTITVYMAPGGGFAISLKQL